MRAANLQSSMIQRIVYDDEAQTLAVIFRGAGRYVYHGVPRLIFDGLKSAGSAGRYFNEFVKGRFRCEPERRRFRPTG